MRRSLAASCILLAVALTGCGGGGTATPTCQPECPPGFHCAESGCVADDDRVFDMTVTGDLSPTCTPACSGSTPYCQLDTRRCVPCIEDSHCPAGQVCKPLGQSTACVMGCNDDGRCAGGGASMKCCGGACVDTAKDGFHCGACGTTCVGNNSRSSCQGGSCVLGTCNAGWGDCNMNPADGCEVNLRIDPRNCAACGTTCSFAHGTAACAGTCYLAACTYGYDDCNGDAKDGCEVSVQVDIRNCGACGALCPGLPRAQNSCVNGACLITQCDGGFANCDNVVNNGCEVNLMTSAAHCGKCGAACGQGLVCVNGGCTCQNCNLANAKSVCVNQQCLVGQCNPNFGDCDGNPVNGCELSLAADTRNCGACGNACAQGLICTNGSCTCPNCNLPNAKTACVNNVCNFVSCLIGFDNCDGNTQNGCEIDLNADSANCGACGARCAMGETCVAGRCIVANGCSQTAKYSMEITPGLWACATDHLIGTYMENNGLCNSGFTPATNKLVQGLAMPSLQQHQAYSIWYQKNAPNNGGYIRTGQKRRGGCLPDAHGDIYVINADNGQTSKTGGWQDLWNGGPSCNPGTDSANNMAHMLAGVICVRGVYEAPAP